jgi:RNA-binding protein NOB1
MAVEPNQKPIHSLVLDTGPLIKNVVSISTIINSAEELYTTPAIISEIRDEATRMRVQTTLMPFLKVRNPSPASYDAVIAFSKKTGDHAVLSRQDLGILALAYEIHCERNGGDWGLRSVPKGPIKLRPEEEEEARKQKEAKDAAKAAQEQAALENGQAVEEDEWSTVTKSKKSSKKSKGQNKKNNKPEQAQSEMILEQPAIEAEPQQQSEDSQHPCPQNRSLLRLKAPQSPRSKSLNLQRLPSHLRKICHHWTSFLHLMVTMTTMVNGSPHPTCPNTRSRTLVCKPMSAPKVPPRWM